MSMVKYIKALVIYHQEPVSDVDRLDTLLEYAYFLVINRHIHIVSHPQLLN